MGKLSATAVKAASKPGRYCDGDGLYLVVSPTGGKSWVCRVQKNGRRRDIGLGSFKKVPLALARERSRNVRMQVERGLDPVIERRKSAGIPTFREAALIVFEENKDSWRNVKHRNQWLSTLETYAFPYIGEISVDELTGADIRSALIDIWTSKHETARRVRQRIMTVIDWAIAQGYRDLPIAMAAINRSLPVVRKTQKNHRALPYAQLPAFMKQIRKKETVTRLAMELLILTAARSGEIRQATWCPSSGHLAQIGF